MEKYSGHSVQMAPLSERDAMIFPHGRWAQTHAQNEGARADRETMHIPRACRSRWSPLRGRDIVTSVSPWHSEALIMKEGR